MYAQLVSFDGPRSADVVAASDRAGRDRISPAIIEHPDIMSALAVTLVLRAPDGGQVVVTVTDTEEALDRANEVIMGTTLLPDEDPALLRAPDRMERYRVVHTMLGDARLVGDEPARQI